MKALSAIKPANEYLLHLADTSLVLAQRNAEWCGHGPILEQDIAITNISLDLLGQARMFYQLAATRINEQEAQGNGVFADKHLVSEDSLAYLRSEREFRNLLITELPRGDWAQTILRQFLFSALQQQLFGELQHGFDAALAAIAAKATREADYHVKWSAEWVIRLGDGTVESHGRMLNALTLLWPYTAEFFNAADYEDVAITGLSLPALRPVWLAKVKEVLQEAGLWEKAASTQGDGFAPAGGKKGIHTEHLGFILAEMQYLQRAYPGAEW